MTLEVVDMHLKVPHSVESPAPPLATQPAAATADVEEYVEGDSWATALHLLNQSTQMMGRLAAQQAVEVKHVASARVVDAHVRVTQRVEAANHSIHETTSATKAKLAHVADDVVVLKEKTFRAVGEHVEPIKAKTVEALLPLKEKAIDTILPITAKGVELVHGRTVETLEKYPKVQQACSKTWTFVKPYVPAVAAQWWQAASSLLAPLATKA